MASAQPAPPAAAPAVSEAPPPPGLWTSGIHLSAQIEAGLMGNPFRPASRYQLDVLEADVLAHLPWLTEGR
jgi:hypothetical protein